MPTVCPWQRKRVNPVRKSLSHIGFHHQDICIHMMVQQSCISMNSDELNIHERLLTGTSIYHWDWPVSSQCILLFTRTWQHLYLRLNHSIHYVVKDWINLMWSQLYESGAVLLFILRLYLKYCYFGILNFNTCVLKPFTQTPVCFIGQLDNVLVCFALLRSPLSTSLCKAARLEGCFESHFIWTRSTMKVKYKH